MLIDANSEQEITSKYPELTPFRHKPKWMGVLEKFKMVRRIKKSKRHYFIDNEPTGFLKTLVDERSKNV